MPLYRSEDLLTGFVDPVVLRQSLHYAQTWPPKRVGLGLAGRPDMKDVTGVEGPHLLEDRARLLHMTEAEKVVNRAVIDIKVVIGKHSKRSKLGCKGDSAMLLSDIQGLNAQRIASQRQGSGEMVPDCRSIHTFQPYPGIVQPAHETGKQCLGVTTRLKVVAGLVEFFAQFKMVVEFTVENNRIAPVWSSDGLMAAADVDDAEAAHAKAEITVRQIAAIVRSSMVDSITLLGDHLGRNDSLASPVPPRDAAHI